MDKQDIQLSKLVRMDDPGQVMAEVKVIVELVHPAFDFSVVDRVFEDIVRLYGGDYPGFKASNTMYHDLQHTTDALLAITRLAHGAVLSGKPFSRPNIELALVATLMHDTGYIQAEDDVDGTGAKYTLDHIERSIEFMNGYFLENGFSRQAFHGARKMLHCTGLNVRADEIRFDDPQVELLGKMLGTADLLGQMADRTYLEKLLYLFCEFKEAGIGGYETELDLLEKTIGFYDLTQKRLTNDLGSVYKYLPAHFLSRHGVGKDLYQEAIDRNMAYLSRLLENRRKNHRDMLRRSGIVDSLERKGI